MVEGRGWLALLFFLFAGAMPLFASGQDEADTPVTSDGKQQVTISVLAMAGETEKWRALAADEAVDDLNAELEAEGADVRVVVESEYTSPGWSDYKRRYTLAAENGTAPDIVVTGHEDIPAWASAGYISKIADSVSDVQGMHPSFAEVFDSLWNSASVGGEIWGIPQDTEARPMYFNKTKLAELGWSEAEIESLPDRIRTGEFTLSDMIATAEDAQDAGVIEAEHGYWHRPSKGGDFIQYYFSHGGEIYDPDTNKLIIDQGALERWYAFQREVVERGVTPDNFIGTDWSVWHDTVSRGNALFWNGGIWHWAEWASEYVEDLGGREYLAENVGYALQPAGDGGEAGTLSHPLVYLVSSDRASGNENTDLAVRLLAHMTTAELNTKHAVESTHLGIVRSQLDYQDYVDDEFLSDVTYMLDYNYYQPNHPMYGMWFDIVWNGMVASEQGEKDPATAAEEVVEQLRFELGDDLIVR